MHCELCKADAEDAIEVAGVQFCADCRTADPAEKLSAHDIVVEWDTRLMRFSAGLGIAEQDPALQLKCAPELWYHKIMNAVARDFEIGDADFDDQIRIRTSDPDAARSILGNEGARSAIIALLGAVRVNEIVGSHVTLEGPTLLISTRPLGGLPPEKVQDLKLHTAALALHLRHRRR